MKLFLDKTHLSGKKHKEKVRIPNPVDLAFEEEIHLIMVEKYSNDEKITRLLITSTAEELQIAKNLKKGFGRRRLESFLDRFGYSYQPRAQVHSMFIASKNEIEFIFRLWSLRTSPTSLTKSKMIRPANVKLLSL